MLVAMGVRSTSNKTTATHFATQPRQAGRVRQWGVEQLLCLCVYIGTDGIPNTHTDALFVSFLKVVLDII